MLRRARVFDAESFLQQPVVGGRVPVQLRVRTGAPVSGYADPARHGATLRARGQGSAPVSLPSHRNSLARGDLRVINKNVCYIIDAMAK